MKKAAISGCPAGLAFFLADPGVVVVVEVGVDFNAVVVCFRFFALEMGVVEIFAASAPPAPLLLPTPAVELSTATTFSSGLASNFSLLFTNVVLGAASLSSSSSSFFILLFSGVFKLVFGWKKLMIDGFLTSRQAAGS